MVFGFSRMGVVPHSFRACARSVHFSAHTVRHVARRSRNPRFAGRFNRFLGFGAYSLGAAIGALALFTVAYILGDRVRKIKLINRLIDDKTYEKAKTAIDKYGGGSYFLLRFIPSMQCITIIVMGLMKVKKEKAHFYVTCVTVLACAVYYLLGVLLGSNIPMLLRILDTFGNVGKILLAVLIAVITAAVIIFKLKNKDKNKKS